MINKQTINSIKNTLVEVYHPLKIYLFGSYAWGKPTEDSDLDLLIVVQSSSKPLYERPVKGYLAFRAIPTVTFRRYSESFRRLYHIGFSAI